MGAISEIIKKLQEAKNLEIEEDENKRIRITIKNGKVDVAVEAVPDLDALSLDQLYALQEEYEERVTAMEDAEPDEDQNPDAYESWEDALDQLQQDLNEIEDTIEERLDEEENQDTNLE